MQVKAAPNSMLKANIPSRPKRLTWYSGAAGALIGAVLLAANATGMIVNFNRPELHVPVQRTWEQARSFEWVMNRLYAVDRTRGRWSNIVLVRILNAVVHQRMVNYHAADNEAYSIFSVGFFDNWILWAAAKIQPEKYRDYFMLDPYRALRRGTGMCGQKVLTLVGLLQERGLKAGVLGLHNHVVVWAEIDAAGRYVIADPDYGVVIPADLPMIKASPALIGAGYADTITLIRRHLKALDGSEGLLDDREDFTLMINDAYTKASEVTKFPAGVDNSFGNTLAFEAAIYTLKWLIPVFLMLPWTLGLLFRRYRIFIRGGAPALGQV